MSEIHAEFEGALSEFLDGTLDARRRESVEQHLEQCGMCRTELEGLRAVTEQARGLGTMPPPRDLWPGIAAALQAPLGIGAVASQVIELPTARWAESAGPANSFAVTWRQLATAATILLTVSVTATWWVGVGVAERPTIAAAPSAASAVIMASAELPGASDALSIELGELEQVLARVSPALDPETVRILDRNLGVIERAIEDSRRALADDPANDFLGAHLERAYQRKLQYLRDATEIARWSS